MILLLPLIKVLIIRVAFVLYRNLSLNPSVNLRDFDLSIQEFRLDLDLSLILACSNVSLKGLDLGLSSVRIKKRKKILPTFLEDKARSDKCM